MQNQDGSYVSRIATAQDFCAVFREEVEALYVLSLLITGEHEKAERSFLAAFADCLQTVHVLREWAGFWAKRTTIQCAIRILRPHLGVPNSPIQNDVPRTIFQMSTLREPNLEQILELPDLERLVLVLTVLEGYSERDCARLIGCSLQQILSARSRVLEQIAGTVAGCCPDGIEEEIAADHVSPLSDRAA